MVSCFADDVIINDSGDKFSLIRFADGMNSERCCLSRHYPFILASLALVRETSDSNLSQHYLCHHYSSPLCLITSASILSAERRAARLAREAAGGAGQEAQAEAPAAPAETIPEALSVPEPLRLLAAAEKTLALLEEEVLAIRRTLASATGSMAST